MLLTYLCFTYKRARDRLPGSKGRAQNLGAFEGAGAGSGWLLTAVSRLHCNKVSAGSDSLVVMELIASNIQVLLQAAEYLDRRERGTCPGRRRGGGGPAFGFFCACGGYVGGKDHYYYLASVIGRLNCLNCFIIRMQCAGELVGSPWGLREREAD